MTPLLTVRGVKTFYGRVQALKGVDLDVNAGEIVTLIGANGAGKSTLMMTIFGRPRARAGNILFDGRDITEVATHEMGFASKVAHRVIFMDRGEIVEDALKEDFFGKPRSDRAQKFLAKILSN